MQSGTSIALYSWHGGRQNEASLPGCKQVTLNGNQANMTRKSCR
ncbi:hypothetical protein [Ktedonobacter racemifer]|uniref:Uncharacterized protein n=1 Tax=Ktedonobacter racemifer DSM 44963 TaxID=485913 RepID=D6TM15_KTERA|nr:hypothetical protein [Ktedonobacter racemifer]EFH86815.1 hypothetical protein Krac_8131 [Ktedonobacter racemifer DSM 44963]